MQNLFMSSQIDQGRYPQNWKCVYSACFLGLAFAQAPVRACVRVCWVTCWCVQYLLYQNSRSNIRENLYMQGDACHSCARIEEARPMCCPTLVPKFDYFHLELLVLLLTNYMKLISYICIESDGVEDHIQQITYISRV